MAPGDQHSLLNLISLCLFSVRLQCCSIQSCVSWDSLGNSNACKLQWVNHLRTAAPGGRLSVSCAQQLGALRKVTAKVHHGLVEIHGLG